MAVVICAAFVIFALAGVPLAFSFGLASLAGLIWSGMSFNILAEKMVFSVNSFPLMAIPFFMLAGELMVAGGIMSRLVALTNSIVGNIRGGLAQGTVLSGVGLATVSGTAVADAAALSSAVGRPLQEAYGRPFSSAVIAASANFGPIIPPSTPMIIYATIAGNLVSISDLFLAGILPGLMIACMMLLLINILARLRGFERTGSPFSLKLFFQRLREAALVILMPIIVIGGIVTGAFTPTEGGAIAVTYSLLAGFFLTRQLTFAALPRVFLRAIVTTAVVGALIALASPLTFLFAISGVPRAIGGALQAITADPTLFLLIIFAVLLVVGMFVESATAYILFVPVLAPIAVTYGIDPLHFGMVFILTIVLGMMTPPIGALLFVMSGINNVKIGEISRQLLPFISIHLAVIIAIIFIPEIVTFLPDLARN